MSSMTNSEALAIQEKEGAPFICVCDKEYRRSFDAFVSHTATCPDWLEKFPSQEAADNGTIKEADNTAPSESAEKPAFERSSISLDDFRPMYRKSLERHEQQQPDFDSVASEFGLSATDSVEVATIKEAIQAQQAQLDGIGDIVASIPEAARETARQAMEIGYRTKIAELSAQLSELQGESPAFLAVSDLAYRLWLAGALPLKVITVKTGKTRNGTRNGTQWLADNEIAAFAFSVGENGRSWDDGSSLPHIPQTTAYVVGYQHPRVASLNLASDKVHIFSDTGKLIKSVSKTTAQGKVMGIAVEFYHGTEVSLVSRCGIAYFGNVKAKSMLEILPEQFFVGQTGAELNGSTVGAKAQTEPETVSA